ncbi:MAG: ABC transporter permease [Chloroflexi bacterium]|nr:ABC transporter permease [Chloroflexota bacterium]
MDTASKTSGVLVTPVPGPAAPIRRGWSLWSFLRRYPVVPIGIIGLLVFTAALAPVLEPVDPLKADLYARNAPPWGFAGGSSAHLLGGDQVGRDILARIIRGARVSAMVMGVSLVMGIGVGTTMGLIAGYFGGNVDEIVMRVVDTWAALPYIMVALVVVVTLGQSFLVLILLLALLSWPGAVRLVRAETLSLKTRDYVALAKIAGASHFRIIFRHILPGVINLVVVSATLSMGSIILTEATLSFLGAGIPPPHPSWGSMISEGRRYLNDAWWVASIPGLCIFLVVMGGNFLGDWLRDRFDPRLRQLA